MAAPGLVLHAVSASRRAPKSAREKKKKKRGRTSVGLPPTAADAADVPGLGLADTNLRKCPRHCTLVSLLRLGQR